MDDLWCILTVMNVTGDVCVQSILCSVMCGSVVLFIALRQIHHSQ